MTIQKYEYNKNHVQVKSIDSKGNETVFTYDKNNRLLTTKDPELHTIVQNYDNAGNIASKTDGKGNITNYRYDQFNRLICVTNALGENTSYYYDLAGNMISQSDGEGRTTTFEYNAANKLLRKIDQGGRTGTAGKYSYEDYKVEKYTYYSNGLPYTKLDRNGNTTTYTYDCHGRMTSQVVGDESISYTYDNNGNTLTMKDSTGLTVRAYDELNRVVTKSVPNMGTAVYRYDIIYTHSDGKKYVGESSKDPKGNLTIKYFDSLGRLKLVASDQQASQFTIYEYDGNGNRVSIKYSSGAMEEYTYYKNNLLKTLVNKNAAETALESYSYTYDLANNQISKSDPKGVTEYTYDVLNRLSTVKEPGGRLTEYIFDMAGNRTIEKVTLGTGITTTLYEYNEQNRMIATIAQVNNEKNITKYSYDGNGNLTSKTREIFKKIDPANPPTPHFGMYIVGQAEGGVTEHAEEIVSGICYYTYDKLNRMIKALPVGASAAEYRYNGDGLRVEKIADSKTTRYMYEYDKVVLELDEKGRQTARNVQGLNPISRTVDGNTMYYLYNGHADVTALIDGTGAIQGTYYYDSFGNQLETTGTVNNPFTYAGYQYDKETGLYYLNARMYDPKTARFMQEDSYRGEFNDPLSLNLYTYCHNEPIMYADPTGHREQLCLQDTGGGSKPSTSGKKKTPAPTPAPIRKKVVTPAPKKVVTPGPIPAPNVVKSASQMSKGVSNSDTVNNIISKVDQVISIPTKFMESFIDGESEYMTELITPYMTGDILEEGYKKVQYVYDTMVNSISKKADPVVKFREDGINTAKNIGNSLAAEFKNEVINGDYKSWAKYLSKIVVNADIFIMGSRYGNNSASMSDEISRSVSSEGGTASKKIAWPPNGGAVAGTEKNVVLTKGYQFDRYGYDGGTYVAPVGTPYEMRALAPGTELKPYKVFEVVKPVRGTGSVTAPWFEQLGGGIQFELEHSIEKLLELKWIKEVTP